MTRSVAGVSAGLAAAWLWLAPALAQDHLPLPRFASLDSNEFGLVGVPPDSLDELAGMLRRVRLLVEDEIASPD